MVANVKYYVVTIVSIFLAIGLGIFIGIMLNSQDILSSQREELVSQLEKKFDYLKEENEKIKNENQNISKQNKKLEEFNRIVYSDMVNGKLEGLRVGVIETNDDYIYSEVNQTLKLAGANVVSNTTIKDLLLTDLEGVKEIYKTIMGKETQNPLDSVINELTQSLINGEITPLISALNKKGYLDITNEYTEGLDYIVIGGGSSEKDEERYKSVDKKIIEIAKNNNISIVGIENENVKESYIEKHKENRISSVDNVDSTIGKITLVLVMDGNPGNYGVKPSAESLAPSIDNTLKEQ